MNRTPSLTTSCLLRWRAVARLGGLALGLCALGQAAWGIETPPAQPGAPPAAPVAQPVTGDPAKGGFLTAPDTSEFDESLDLGRVGFDIIDIVPREPIAGAPVTLVFNLRNNDSEAWAPTDLKFTYDLYDSSKRLLLREDLNVPAQPLDPGTEMVARGSFDLPVTAQGVMFVRLRISVKGQLAFISGPEALTVGGGGKVKVEKGKVKFTISAVSLSDPSPKVGETLTVDVLLKNDGKDDWGKGDLSAALELRDAKNKAVGKVKPVALDGKVAPGKEDVIQLKVAVPAKCEAKCMVVVLVKAKGEKKPAQAPPVALKALSDKGVWVGGVNFTGDATFVYTTNPKQSIPGSTPPTNLKFSGPGFAGALKGLNIIRDEPGGGQPGGLDDWSGRNFVGEFATKNLKLKAGKFTPSYNEFTVNGKEMEARELYYKAGPFLVSALHGRTAKADAASKVYERQVWGGSVQYQPGKTRRARVSYFNIDDKLDSLALARQPGTKPIGGAVWSFDADWVEHRHTVRVGHAISRVNDNLLTGKKTGYEQATKYRHAVKFKRQTHELDMVRVDSNYTAIASPGAKNASKWTAKNTFKLGGWLKNVTLGLTNSKADNNLRNERGQNNVLTRLHGASLTINNKRLLLGLMPSLNYNGTLTRQNGRNKPNTRVNAQTVVQAFATSWNLPWEWDLSANFSTTQFDDEVAVGKDTKSQRLGLNLTRMDSKFKPVLTYNLSKQSNVITQIGTSTAYYGYTFKIPHSARFSQNLAGSYQKTITAGKPTNAALISLNTKLALPRWKANLNLNQTYATTNNSTSKEKFTFTNVATLSRQLSKEKTLFFDYKYTRKPPTGKSEPHSVFVIRLTTKI